jgi:hypothetical protein
MFYPALLGPQPLSGRHDVFVFSFVFYSVHNSARRGIINEQRFLFFGLKSRHYMEMTLLIKAAASDRVSI